MTLRLAAQQSQIAMEVGPHRGQLISIMARL